MREILIIAAVAAVFVFGDSIMKRIDCFLAKNNTDEDIMPYSEDNCLRIGFSNPMTAGDISDIIKAYSKKYPDISVRLFGGSNEDLVKAIYNDEADVVFLPETTGDVSDTYFDIRKIYLYSMPIALQSGLSFEPINKESSAYSAVSRRDTKSFAVIRFIECLKTQ